MSAEQTMADQVSRYLSDFLDSHFGEPPPQATVIIRKPFIVIHLQSFLMPGERLLLKRNETKRVMETRDILMEGARSEFLEKLSGMVGFKLSDLYMDWNLEQETGFFLAVSEEEANNTSLVWKENADKKVLKEKIIEASAKTQRRPDHTEIYWLNDETLLIERFGIMIDIEIELIKNGVTEELRLAKRPLEHRLLESLNLEPNLKREVQELFVDWHFEKDRAYLVLILKASTA